MRVRNAQIEDAGAIAKVNVDTWRSAFCGLISDSFLAALSYDDREKNFKDFIGQTDAISFACVAEDDEGNVLGFAMGGKEREGIQPYAGEIYALYVLQRWQNQGIGRMLVKAAASQLFQSGISSLMLWTLAAGSACGFYEKLGGELISTKVFTIAEEEILFAAYGWENIEALL
ncbi:gcn5-related [hydrocarbon metagenome]|uniref:Gcn5-related n=1 Tax=hydrocarbon metagenome TaxID=938273 RepID=A0A0W8E510_9ZZZZ